MPPEADRTSPMGSGPEERLHSLRRVGKALETALRRAGRTSRAASVQRAADRWARAPEPRPAASAATAPETDDASDVDTAVAHVSGPLSGVYVMVVDDNADSRDIVATSLRRQGALVVACSSPTTGLRLVTTVAPDVLISDLAMPSRSGAWLIRAVRRMPGRLARRVPAIAVTAYRESQSRAKALGAGFDEYLEKPIDLDRLWRLVGRLAAERRTAPPWVQLDG